MEKKELTQEQKDSKNAQLERGLAYDEISRSKGVEILRQLIQQNTENFMISTLNGEYKTIEELNLARGTILGMNSIIKSMEQDMEAVRNESAGSAKE